MAEPYSTNQLTDFQQDVIRRLAELQKDTDAIKEKLAEDYKILHGNGRPGLVTRITLLETHWVWMKWMAGFVGGILGAIIGFIVSTIIAKIL